MFTKENKNSWTDIQAFANYSNEHLGLFDKDVKMSAMKTEVRIECVYIQHRILEVCAFFRLSLCCCCFWIEPKIAKQTNLNSCNNNNRKNMSKCSNGMDFYAHSLKWHHTSIKVQPFFLLYYYEFSLFNHNRVYVSLALDMIVHKWVMRCSAMSMIARWNGSLPCAHNLISQAVHGCIRNKKKKS